MILNIGHLSKSAEVRETKLERLLLRMIESTTTAALSLMHASIDALILRVKTCGSTNKRLYIAYESRHRKPEIEH